MDYESSGIELCSASLTQDIGFFDKLLFDNSLKDWFSSMRKAFDFHKSIYKELIKHTRNKRKRLMQARQVNWNYFDIHTGGYPIHEDEFT